MPRPPSPGPAVEARQPGHERPVVGESAENAVPSPATRQSPAGLEGWHADGLVDLRGALEGQCALRRPPGDWAALCRELWTVPIGDAVGLRNWIAQRFAARPLLSASGQTTGLITGYHEPELQGSRVRSLRHPVPLHRVPERNRGSARATRESIERGNLLQGDELVWLDDPVEAFFLHVQGAGRIRLTDGSVMRVGYAGDNGQAYRAVGSVLVARGAMRAHEVDAPAIKAWLRANPEAANRVMQSNPRYIYFRELTSLPTTAGPPGSLGVPLTPMRSIAVDPRRVPSGSLLWLETTDPIDGSPIRRLVVAQDTGAAIVGDVRADLFWGTGLRAAQGAGLMKQAGRLWLLEPVDRAGQ
jgi:membrane-bound lytic murein transglycosylase A